ncbi:MAG: 50S ribosomal protein L25/general stress protein Ctc, partial [Hyphomicrobiaceae bacterium]|nr:50S ribosomal protein L25/general stress protein Ctc [Hyphomicrobiaceae bacterium]
MRQSYELKATRRDRVGKGAARAVRREGLTPAVIYGDKKDPLPISVSSKEVTMKIYGGGFLTHVATIDVDGEKIKVIPRDYQLDVVKDFPLHIDFLRVSDSSVLTVMVPVHFVNQEKSPGIKRGGVLNVVRHEVELEVNAANIPDSLEIDLTGLELGDGVHISHVKLPEGAAPTITDRDF